LNSQPVFKNKYFSKTDFKKTKNIAQLL